MRIFAVCHRVPYPPNKGEKIRSYHFLKRLAEREEVHLFATADPASDCEHAKALEEHFASVTLVPIRFGVRKIASLSLAATPLPLTVPTFFSWRIWRALKARAREVPPDVLLLASSSTGAYAWALRDVPAVMDFVDADSVKWGDLARASKGPGRLVYARESTTLRWAERVIAKRCTASVVTTEREAALLREIAPAAPLHVIHNGVDTAYFDPSRVTPRVSVDLARDAEDPDVKSAPPSVIFFGMMDYPPNVEAVEWFAGRVLPALRERHPGLRFVIAGGRPNDAVLALGEEPDIEVTGFVDDMRPIVRGCDVCVFPLQVARGVQNKVLEGMAMGMPVVVSSVAAGGIDDLRGDEMLVRDTPEEWLETVDGLLRDASARESLGARARSFVESIYDWGPQAERFRELLGEVASKARD